MNLTRTAFGTWSGGRYMHFGEMLEESEFCSLIQHAYESGIKTFVTADVYGGGRADSLLGQALHGVERDSYCLVGAIGHDFYMGQRQGSSGYPRFTDPTLRDSGGYQEFVRMATEKSLERCQTDHFDLLMLHNPDHHGYRDDSVWNAFAQVKAEGMAHRLGIAPGPANGFTLDLIDCFENFHEVLDWAMIILNPLEPWPGRLCLPAAEKFGIDVLTRVADHGGLLFDDVKPGHTFRDGDHRSYRPEGWVEHGHEKIGKMRSIVERYKLPLIHFAALWNLGHTPVKSVVPTFIQEAGDATRPVSEKVQEFAQLPASNVLAIEDLKLIAEIGDNTGCMNLKGASKRHQEQVRPDEWPITENLLALAERWNLGSTW